jgi:aspartate-semialdehyde dehydrogenase
VDVAIVGAAGTIGRRLIEELGASALAVKRLKLFDAPAHLGKVAHFRNAPIRIESLTDAAAAGVQLAIGFGDDDAWVPKFVKAGAVAIDHSTASRTNAGIPLVVAGVNDADIRKHQGVVASPNCATVPLALALKPLHDRFTIRRVVVTTLQAVSGAGGVEELEHETRSLILDDRVFKRAIFDRPIAFNVLPSIGKIGADGTSVEERETSAELSRLLPDVQVSATCLRVPVKNAHGESIHVEFSKPVTRASALEALRGAPRIVLEDQGATPAEVSGRGEVYVGRVRQDLTVSSGLALWVVADNLRRGTALNAVEIAEVLFRQ